MSYYSSRPKHTASHALYSSSWPKHTVVHALPFLTPKAYSHTRWSCLLLYSAILRSRVLIALLSHVISKWVIVAFYSMFWISTEVVHVQHCLLITWLVPCETAVILACSVYTIQPCTMSHHYMQSHIHRMHVCLAGTCHPHFWQNDQDLLHATAVTQGWNR